MGMVQAETHLSECDLKLPPAEPKVGFHLVYDCSDYKEPSGINVEWVKIRLWLAI